MIKSAQTLLNHQLTVAYFSMEIALDTSIPTYSGGLGVLAGDALKTAADLGISMAGVTLLYRKGYFRQHIDSEGNQTSSRFVWAVEQHLQLLPQKVSVMIEGREVKIQAWKHEICGVNGHKVPVYFLDTALPENTPWDQNLCGALYNRDTHFRLCQEVILGLGGVAILKAQEQPESYLYHMNEGHSALLTLALLEQQMASKALSTITEEDRLAVRKKCVFTTHTPVAAGHDHFPRDLVKQILGEEKTHALEIAGGFLDGVLNMTFLALNFSHYVNGVAMRHGEVSRTMFPNYPIDSITNGIHVATWVSPFMRALFDTYIPNWSHDNFNLRHALAIPLAEIREAHIKAKVALIAEVEKRNGVHLDPNIFTIGFARRMTAYKRPTLIFSDMERLKRIASQVGPFQIIFAGKAHPRDESGKTLIRDIFKAAKSLEGVLNIIFLEEYDMNLAKHLLAGVDIWLNTPMRPLEASGTSGMKAAINGVPSLSIMDGWWIEGHTEGVTGWSIGEYWKSGDHHAEEVESLYSKLENIIIPLYYKNPQAFDQIRQSTISLNGSYFQTQRMLVQYLVNAYAKM